MITIIKSIFAFFAFTCKIVYRIFKIFRIRILVLYLAVCAVLQLTLHVFDGKEFIFWIGTAGCIALTLLAWALYLKRKFQKPVKRRMPSYGKDEVSDETEQTFDEEECAVAATIEQKTKRKNHGKERPKYYNVAGRPDYIFAEYSDRFELFKKSSDGLFLVRTDYEE